MKLDASQQRAVSLVLTDPFGIVTGGPGTGKTFSLRTALDELDERGRSYVLAAPTGKAARRMQEATGRDALTVHRLLEYDPRGRGYGKSGGFLRTSEEPLEVDLVVVDESSMLDVELAAALFDACRTFGEGKRTRLVLVGDKDQLPPVGAGRVFADLVESGLVPVALLDTLHRSAAASWVATQSREVLAGRAPSLEQRADFRFVEHDDRTDAVAATVALAVSEGARGQVIVPQNTGPAGAETLNAAIQRRVTPADAPGWKVRGQQLRRGDRVIQTRNDYQLADGRGVMNGEIGTVEAVSSDTMKVRFEADAEGGGFAVEYARDAARSLRLAYALTCHKMQGSEVPWAIVLAHSTHTRMLTRGWLYTAVTRAREGVVIVGDRLAMQRAVKNASDAKRNSGLVARLREMRAASATPATNEVGASAAHGGDSNSEGEEAA